MFVPFSNKCSIEWWYDMVVAIMMNIVWDVTPQKTALMNSISKLHVLTDFL